MERKHYLKWLSVLCVVLAVFGVGIFAVGYQPLSVGRVATICLLALAAVVLAWLSRRARS
ncbi:preprotein translocase subunit SecE [Ellagibacter isourolithinifaciens]|uniref:preprotein translocase subunit SecE n=1 Tax=Ellagibacter isourolithinifaciens TaxID=2137581 RepID=UPI003AEF2A19